MRPKIRWGTTRFVILVGPFAIKIARLRLLFYFCRLLLHMWNGEVKVRLAKRDTNTVKSGLKYLSSGVRANLNEWEVWRKTHSPCLIPTMYSLFGLVNVQRRGEKRVGTIDVFLFESSLIHSATYAKLKELEKSTGERLDLHSANLCYYQGDVRLLDYGSAEALSTLCA